MDRLSLPATPAQRDGKPEPTAGPGGSDARLHTSGWSASLECTLSPRAGRTVLASRRHRGPLLIQRPFYPEPDGRCHLYVVHPPGGVAAGDHLRQHFLAEPGSKALITTPAASKFYRSRGPQASQETQLQLADGAELEWLPQESILFSAAQLTLTTRIELQGSARFLGWEILALGRPASGEVFAEGRLRQRFELFRDGRPLLLERADFRGGDAVLSAPWGLGGMPVTATLVCTSEDPSALVTAARTTTPPVQAPALCAATALPGLAVYRYLGPWARGALQAFEHVWRLWRPLAFGTAACAPRIWLT